MIICSLSFRKSVWLPNQSETQQGVEWQDGIANKGISAPEFEIGDAQYFKLYNSIQLQDVIPVIESVFYRNLNKTKELKTFDLAE